MAQATDPVVGTLPAIDPQPSDNPAGNDDGPAPWYYNGAEWKTGKFQTETIAKEGSFSKFSDSPQDPAGNTIGFETYLVADSLTDPFIGAKEFCVLAGFSWTYTGGTAGMAGQDTSTVGAAIPINAAAIGTINTALGNSMMGGNLMGWKAPMDCDLSACYLPPYVPKYFELAPVVINETSPPVQVPVFTDPTPSLPAGNVPIEIVELSLQSVQPIQVQMSDTGPGPEHGTQLQGVILNGPQDLQQPQVQHQIQVDTLLGDGQTPAELILGDDGELFTTGFRPGDTQASIFYDIFIPGLDDPFQEWWWVVGLDPALAEAGAVLSELSIAERGSPLSPGSANVDSFFDITYTIDFSGYTGGPIVPGTPLAGFNAQAFFPPADAIPEPATVGLLLMAGAGMLSRRRRAA